MVSYVSLVMLLADSGHVAQHHEKVSVTWFGFAVTWLIATVIKALSNGTVFGFELALWFKC